MTDHELEFVLEALEDAVLECAEADTSLALDRKLEQARDILRRELGHDEEL